MCLPKHFMSFDFTVEILIPFFEYHVIVSRFFDTVNRTGHNERFFDGIKKGVKFFDLGILLKVCQP